MNSKPGRLPKSEFERSKPPSNFNEPLERKDHEGYILYKGKTFSEAADGYDTYRKAHEPKEVHCPFCGIESSKTKWDYCWKCQIGLCVNCLADDKQCFRPWWPSGKLAYTSICRKCLCEILNSAPLRSRYLLDDFDVIENFGKVKYPNQLPFMPHLVPVSISDLPRFGLY